MLQGLTSVLSILPFTVDTFTPDPARKPQFLSHAHKDHTVDIAKHGADVYCTDCTRALVCLKFPTLLDTAIFHTLELDEPLHVSWGGQSFTVRAVDASHCPGSCSFIFQGAFGTVVHTGDARLSPSTLRGLRAGLEGAPVDLLYVDCTFGSCAYVGGIERRARLPASGLPRWCCAAGACARLLCASTA